MELEHDEEEQEQQQRRVFKLRIDQAEARVGARILRFEGQLELTRRLTREIQAFLEKKQKREEELVEEEVVSRESTTPQAAPQTPPPRPCPPPPQPTFNNDDGEGGEWIATTSTRRRQRAMTLSPATPPPTTTTPTTTSSSSLLGFAFRQCDACFVSLVMMRCTTCATWKHASCTENVQCACATVPPPLKPPQQPQRMAITVPDDDDDEAAAPPPAKRKLERPPKLQPLRRAATTSHRDNDNEEEEEEEEAPAPILPLGKRRSIKTARFVSYGTFVDELPRAMLNARVITRAAILAAPATTTTVTSVDGPSFSSASVAASPQLQHAVATNDAVALLTSPPSPMMDVVEEQEDSSTPPPPSAVSALVAVAPTLGASEPIHMTRTAATTTVTAAAATTSSDASSSSPPPPPPQLHRTATSNLPSREVERRAHFTQMLLDNQAAVREIYLSQHAVAMARPESEVLVCKQTSKCNRWTPTDDQLIQYKLIGYKGYCGPRQAFAVTWRQVTIVYRHLNVSRDGGNNDFPLPHTFKDPRDVTAVNHALSALFNFKPRDYL